MQDRPCHCRKKADCGDESLMMLKLWMMDRPLRLVFKLVSKTTMI
jgi:hypothetical protein